MDHNLYTHVIDHYDRYTCGCQGLRVTGFAVRRTPERDWAKRVHQLLQP